MSFFKDFKDVFSQDVDELIPGEVLGTKDEDDLVVNTLDQEVDFQSELTNLENLFEKVQDPIITSEDSLEKGSSFSDLEVDLELGEMEDDIVLSSTSEVQLEETMAVMPEIKEEMDKEEQFVDTEMKTGYMGNVDFSQSEVAMGKEISDEVTVITSSTIITGNIESTGSLEIKGLVNGNVQCNGKITVTGSVKGDTTSAELFADSAKIEGEIKTEGTVKIGSGTVVIGNITASSAVIAGAVKGDVDICGPVVIDTSAVIKGDIKSRSVQINNGAVIDGFCSPCYTEVDMEKLFEEEESDSESESV